jgi:hypothetical protein
MKTENRGARGARTSLVLVAFFGVLALAGACSSSDDNPSPNTGGKRTQGGSTATGGSAGNGRGGAGGGGKQAGGSGGASDTGGSDVGGEPGTGGSAGAGDGGNGANGGSDVGGGGSGGAAGSGPDNTCPATDLQFLNRPNSSQCSKFPNTKARLPLLNADGSLPPLPGS